MTHSLPNHLNIQRQTERCPSAIALTMSQDIIQQLDRSTVKTMP